MILVLSPHGDDAELAMGATIAKLAVSHKVSHIAMTVTGYKASDNREITQLERIAELRNAGKALGIEAVPMDFKDNHLSSQLPEIVRTLDRLIEQLEPTDIYTCLPWFNADHTALYQATLATMRSAPRTTFWAYEMPNQGLGYQMPEHGWRYTPVSYLDLSAKQAALACYESQQLGTRGGPVSIQGAWSLTSLRGSEIGSPHAERQLLLRSRTVGL